jgi:predicted enzyme related to lactoylglutathione lyase
MHQVTHRPDTGRRALFRHLSLGVSPLQGDAMPNPFVHVELHTKDVPKAKEFYSKLFGWKLSDMPMPGGQGSYTMVDVGEGTGGGMFQNPDPNVPPHWLAYVGVDDVATSTRRAKEVGDFGRMSVLRDPTGAHIALWQAIRKE